MDIRTLPERERAIYNRLRENFTLHFETHAFGSETVRLLHPSNLEELLDGRDPFEDVSAFPFWARLWEAALVLGHVLVSVPHKNGDRLLELGAGLGVPGLAAATAGFETVLSDYEETILDFQRVSRAASSLSNVRSLHLDWLDPPELESFDVITGAEILFKEEYIEPLLDLCKKYLKANGVMYLAHDVRRKSLPRFLAAAEKDFVIGSGKKRVTSGDASTDILLNRLQRRE